MASLDQIGARVEELSRRHRDAASRKAKLQGKLDEKRQELKRLKAEIEEAGFDPKTLKEDRQRLEAELEQLMARFEAELSVVEQALDEYEK
jgi:septal ring factor EnvC (AmiA/AmiB activator)